MAAVSSMVLAGLAIGGALAQSQAAKAQGIAQQAQAEQNARLAEMQAKDAEARGEKEASLHRRKVKAMVGQQKAALAAHGLSISDGTGLELIGQTAEFGEADVATIRQNAYREAFGYKTQALNYRSQGKFDYMGARNEANATLLTGGLRAAEYITAGMGKSSSGGTRTSKTTANAGSSYKGYGNYA